MRRLRNKKRIRQPQRIAAPPRRAERLYVGAMRDWAASFRADVLAEIDSSNELQLASLQQMLRTDAKDEEDEPNWFLTFFGGLGARLLAGLRRRAVRIPSTLSRIGQEVSALVKSQTVRVLGVAPEQISVAHNIEGWVKQNVSLIQGLQEQQLSKIEQIIEGARGRTTKEISDALLRELDITAQRAEFIASDQVLKLNAQITQDAHKQSGVRRYKWISMEDSKVRNMHRDLHQRSLMGETFDYDDPPESEEDGSSHNPGEGYGCRCQAQPVLDEPPDEN